MAEAFGKWMEQVLGDRGLIVYDSSDPASKPLVSQVFARELSTPGQTVKLAALAGSDLTARGYHAQVHPQDDSLALFRLDGGRRAIRQQDGRFVVGDQQYPASSLVKEAIEQPGGFSPNVLLRPVVQDTLFPTICYVPGPSELAYLGQLRRSTPSSACDAADVPARVGDDLDSAALRSSRSTTCPRACRHRTTARERLAEDQIPPVVEESFTEAARTIEAQMDAPHSRDAGARSDARRRRAIHARPHAARPSDAAWQDDSGGEAS